MSTINVDTIVSESVGAVTINDDLIVTGTNSIVPYKKYVAWLGQSSPTAAPLAEVLENTLGATITWSRTSAGTYLATASASVFTQFKTIVFTTVAGGAGAAYPTQILTNRQSSTEVYFITVLTDSVSTPVDSRLGGCPIEIRVYP
jgi:hypothetical protein